MLTYDGALDALRVMKGATMRILARGRARDAREYAFARSGRGAAAAPRILTYADVC
jgi:hypothetical protein